MRFVCLVGDLYFVCEISFLNETRIFVFCFCFESFLLLFVFCRFSHYAISIISLYSLVSRRD